MHVQVRVAPANAVVTFDGMRVRAPYDVHLTRSATTHRLEASLPGYTTVTQSVELSRDRVLTIALRPTAPVRPAPVAHAVPPVRPTPRCARRRKTARPSAAALAS